MLRKRTLTSLGLALLLILSIVPLTMAQMTPAVTASDQTVSDGTVTVDSVTSDGPGWIVIHLDDNGSPGAVIGHAAVEDGENTDVSVTLDQDITEETTLWAMLHTDAGEQGTYEFPGADAPVTDAEDNIVMQSFVASPAMQEATPTATAEAMEEMTPTATAETMEEMTPTATTEAMTPTATSEAPSTMPETGSTGGSNTGLLLGLAGLIVLLLGGALYWWQTANTKA